MNERLNPVELEKDEDSCIEFAQPGIEMINKINEINTELNKKEEMFEKETKKYFMES